MKADLLEDPGIDGGMILKWILKKWGGGIDYIDLAHDRDRSDILVNAVMNLWFSFSGSTLLYEVSYLVYYLCRK